MSYLIECETYHVRPGNEGRLLLELEGVSDTQATPIRDSLPRMTKTDVARAFGTTVATVERWMRAKRNPIPYRRVGRFVRFHAHEIDEWSATGAGPAARHARERINLICPQRHPNTGI